jgi:putative transcriptional regulator
MDIRCALAAGFLFALACAAQSVHVEDLAQGKIIVTPRDSPDPHFANSVIVLAHYDASGALGLMIHFKTDLTIQKALKDIKGAEKRTDPVFVGGPVELPAVMALVRSKSEPEGASRVTGNLYLMTSKQSVAAALAASRPASDMRVFIGYSGWGPGQLEREVRRAGWFIFDYDEGLVFDEHPDSLWNRMIAKTERRMAIVPGPESWSYALRGYR